MGNRVTASNRFSRFWSMPNDECRVNGLEELPFSSAKTLYDAFLTAMRNEAARRVREGLPPS